MSDDQEAQLALPGPAGSGQLSISPRDPVRAASAQCDCGWRSGYLETWVEALTAMLSHDANVHGQGVPSRPDPSQ
jgi:hypothetical protein